MIFYLLIALLIVFNLDVFLSEKNIIDIFSETTMNLLVKIIPVILIVSILIRFFNKKTDADQNIIVSNKKLNSIARAMMFVSVILIIIVAIFILGFILFINGVSFQ